MTGGWDAEPIEHPCYPHGNSVLDLVGDLANNADVRRHPDADRRAPGAAHARIRRAGHQVARDEERHASVRQSSAIQRSGSGQPPASTAFCLQRRRVIVPSLSEGAVLGSKIAGNLANVELY
jgi:hypothetical protein